MNDDGLDAAADRTPKPPEAVPIQKVALNDCEEVAAAWFVPESEVQPYLPQGFEPAGPGAAGQGTGAVQLITATCDLGNATDVSIATAWLMVEPPREYRVDGVGAYLIAPWTVLTDEGAAATLASWGLAATAGDVGFDAPLAGPPAQMDEVTASDGDFSLTLNAAIPSRGTQPNHPIFRLFLVSDGEVTGAIDLDGGSHPHWEIGASKLQTRGTAPFPAPQQPGIAIHGFEGQLHLTYVPRDRLGETVTG